MVLNVTTGTLLLFIIKLWFVSPFSTPSLNFIPLVRYIFGKRLGFRLGRRSIVGVDVGDFERERLGFVVGLNDKLKFKKYYQDFPNIPKLILQHLEYQILQPSLHPHYLSQQTLHSSKLERDLVKSNLVVTLTI